MRNHFVIYQFKKKNEQRLKQRLNFLSCKKTMTLNQFDNQQTTKCILYCIDDVTEKRSRRTLKKMFVTYYYPEEVRHLHFDVCIGYSSYLPFYYYF